jgi:hypothetical protein
MAASLDDVVTVQSSGVTYLGALVQAIKSVFPQLTGTSTTATAGGVGALPATVAGYMSVTLPNGTTVKVPYYSN